ncbi:HIT domain-containing protein [Patescibacteria group bacterium]
MECLFCNIVSKESLSDIVLETEDQIVFKDIYPKAPIHLLILPKKHIESIKDMTEEDIQLVGNLILTAKNIAKEQNMKGYKLVFNIGREGGQMIDHIHLHLLSGWKTKEERYIKGMP